MPDQDRQTSPAIDYLARAAALHEEAEASRSAEARENLDKVARWYEILARHVQRRRRNPIKS